MAVSRQIKLILPGNKELVGLSSTDQDNLIKASRVSDIIVTSIIPGGTDAAPTYDVGLRHTDTGVDDYSSVTLPIASATKSGLMTKEQYTKLAGLLQFSVIKANDFASLPAVATANKAAIYLVPKASGSTANNKYDQYVIVETATAGTYAYEWICDTEVTASSTIVTEKHISVVPDGTTKSFTVTDTTIAEAQLSNGTVLLFVEGLKWLPGRDYTHSYNSSTNTLTVTTATSADAIVSGATVEVLYPVIN